MTAERLSELQDMALEGVVPEKPLNPEEAGVYNEITQRLDAFRAKLEEYFSRRDNK